MKLDLKSLAAGIIIGTMGITTAFAATGIQSAVLSDTRITLNGEALNKPLVSVTMDGEQIGQLYAPVDELTELLGYSTDYNSAENTMNLVPGSSRQQGDNVAEGNVVLNLANHAGQHNIAESGSFQAEDNQILTLHITSDLKGGSVNLFLFTPDGEEQRIIIGSESMTKEIPLKQGTWNYNCSGMFEDGGNIKIVGSVVASAN